MEFEIGSEKINIDQVELKARELRAEALSYGIKTSVAWVAQVFSALTHRTNGKVA